MSTSPAVRSDHPGHAHDHGGASVFARRPVLTGVAVGVGSLAPHFFLPAQASLGFAAVLIALIAGIAGLGVAAALPNYMILKRLLLMVDTVRAGDPFVAANAYRLHAIAWLLVALQLISMTIAGIGRVISTEEHPFHLDAGFSVNSWLAVVLCFVLARVFAEGTLMREDLEGTV